MRIDEAIAGPAAPPTLADFFNLRFAPAAHLLQSARLAKKKGVSEEIVLACLLHDAGQSLCKTDHGYWGAQIFEPYVSERVTFAIKYHQALRFYPDPEVGYEYPVSYYQTFGVDYEPLPHIKAAYEYARNHKWYMDARLVTTNDLYAFLTTEPNAEVGTIHPKAMPVILTTPEEVETWMTAPPDEVLKLQRPLSDGSLKIVARGVKEDPAGQTT